MKWNDVSETYAEAIDTRMRESAPSRTFAPSVAHPISSRGVSARATALPSPHPSQAAVAGEVEGEDGEEPKSTSRPPSVEDRVRAILDDIDALPQHAASHLRDVDRAKLRRFACPPHVPPLARAAFRDPLGAIFQTSAGGILLGIVAATVFSMVTSTAPSAPVYSSVSEVPRPTIERTLQKLLRYA